MLLGTSQMLKMRSRVFLVVTILCLAYGVCAKKAGKKKPSNAVKCPPNVSKAGCPPPLPFCPEEVLTRKGRSAAKPIAKKSAKSKKPKKEPAGEQCFDRKSKETKTYYPPASVNPTSTVAYSTSYKSAVKGSSDSKQPSFQINTAPIASKSKVAISATKSVVIKSTGISEIKPSASKSNPSVDASRSMPNYSSIKASTSGGASVSMSNKAMPVSSIFQRSSSMINPADSINPSMIKPTETFKSIGPSAYDPNTMPVYSNDFADLQSNSIDPTVTVAHLNPSMQNPSMYPSDPSRMQTWSDISPSVIDLNWSPSSMWTRSSHMYPSNTEYRPPQSSMYPSGIYPSNTDYRAPSSSFYPSWMYSSNTEYRPPQSSMYPSQIYPSNTDYRPPQSSMYPSYSGYVYPQSTMNPSGIYPSYTGYVHPLSTMYKSVMYSSDTVYRPPQSSMYPSGIYPSNSYPPPQTYPSWMSNSMTNSMAYIKPSSIYGDSIKPSNTYPYSGASMMTTYQQYQQTNTGMYQSTSRTNSLYPSNTWAYSSASYVKSDMYQSSNYYNTPSMAQSYSYQTANVKTGAYQPSNTYAYSGGSTVKTDMYQTTAYSWAPNSQTAYNTGSIQPTAVDPSRATSVSYSQSG